VNKRSHDNPLGSDDPQLQIIWTRIGYAHSIASGNRQLWRIG
jgi:hypothetical protein